MESYLWYCDFHWKSERTYLPIIIESTCMFNENRLLVARTHSTPGVVSQLP